jgi:hypothetical protein
MAATNENVAARFASALLSPIEAVIRPITGSNMYAKPVYHDSRDRHTQTTNGVFTSLATVDSYRTTIAHIVQNHHTGKREVWLSRLRYSDTTGRHLSYIGSAVRELERTTGNTYTTYHTSTDLNWANRVDCDGYTSIDNPLQARVRTVTNLIIAADTPKLHYGTRVTHLRDAVLRCDSMLYNYTNDVPEGYAQTMQSDGQKLIDELRSLREYALNLISKPLDEIRASVRGFKALNAF